MSKSKTTRRTFIAATATGVVTVGVGAYLTRQQWMPTETDGMPAKTDAAPLTLSAATSRLLRVVGPWPKSDDEIAVDFVTRYLSTERVESFKGQEGPIMLLASRYSDTDVAVENLQLDGMSPPQRTFLVGLVSNLYAEDEVRAYMRKYPPIGSCVGDITRHTLVPT